MNNELDKIVIWLACNKLTINIKKTKFMVFQPPKKPSVHNPIIKINECSLEKVKDIKFLGVMVDDKLNWKKHISYVKCKISKTLGILHKARQTLGRQHLTSLYNSVVLPYLMYCNLLWGATNITTLQPLIKVWKAAIRYVCNLRKHASTSNSFH